MSTERGLKGNERRGFGVVLVVAVCAALLGPLATARPARADVTFDQRMLSLINEQRATAGVGPVQGSPVLNTVAGPGPYLGCGASIAGRATDMGARNYFSHTILGCGTQSVFNILSGITGLVYSAAGENIAWMNGTTDPMIAAQRLMNDLMASPAHKANILDARFNTVGIGSWTTLAGQTWTGAGTPLANVWIAAQVFAQTPLALPPLLAPAVTATPTSLAFGDGTVGTSGATRSVTVQNTGTAALAVSSATVSGANATDFGIASNTCGTSVAPGATCSIAVGFTPGAVGGRSATLGISDNAAGSPRAIALSGNGTAAALTGAPTNVVATGGEGRIDVSWGPAASGPAPVGYGVFAYDAAGYTGQSAWVCATCTGAALTGLANGKQYYAMVSGYNGTAWGTSANSAWVSVLAVPGLPVNPQTMPGNGSLTVSWQAPATPGAAIDRYGVYVYDAGGFTGKYAWVCATCVSATVAGLGNGQSYYAGVFAHNANGWGDQVTTPWMVVGTPTAAGNIVATGGNGSISVTWSAAQAAGAPVQGYGAYVYDTAGYTGKNVWVCSTCTAATITGLTNGRQYIVAVHASNVYGWSVPGYSNLVTL